MKLTARPMDAKLPIRSSCLSFVYCRRWQNYVMTGQASIISRNNVNVTLCIYFRKQRKEKEQH